MRSACCKIQHFHMFSWGLEQSDVVCWHQDRGCTKEPCHDTSSIAVSSCSLSWIYPYFIFRAINEKKMHLTLKESTYLASISDVLGLCKICCSLLRHQDNIPIFSSSRQHPLSTLEIWSIFFWKSDGVFEIHDWKWFWKLVLGSLICFLK